MTIYGDEFFLDEQPLPNPEVPILLTKEKVLIGEETLARSDAAVYEDDDLLLLRDQRTTLRSLAQCVNMNWLPILVSTT